MNEYRKVALTYSGKLFYRGYDVEDIVHGLIKEKRFGFEEVAYLMLSGNLPGKDELASFQELINDRMPLEQKTKMISDLEGHNIMNIWLAVYWKCISMIRTRTIFPKRTT